MKSIVVSLTTPYLTAISKLAKEYLSRRGPAELHKRKLVLLAIVNVLVAGNVWAQVVAPTNLRAASVSSSAVSLSWTDPNNKGEKSVVVSRSAQSLTAGFSDIATLAARTTSYTDSTVVPGSTYYYRVSAVGSRSTRYTSSAISVIVPPISPATTYTITTSPSPSAGGTTSGDGTYNSGSTVTVTATANSCYNFVNWTESGSVVSTSPSYSFTATANRTLVANFSQPSYSITTSSSPTAGGTTSGGGIYVCGSTVTITATENSGYSFANWTENGTVVSTD